MSKRARRLAAGLFPLPVEILENRLLLSAATTTTLITSSDPIVQGQIISMTATVASTGGTAGGTVTFMDGTSLIGTVAVNPTTEQAVGFTKTLSLGSHQITATYNGNSGFAASDSNAVLETVDPTSDTDPSADVITATSLVASSNPIALGEVVALTASVTGATNPTGGIVTFMDGKTLIGTVDLNATTSRAVGFTKYLPDGTGDITAIYDGSAGFSTSTSAAVDEVVGGTLGATTTTTTLVSSANPITAGDTVALTATVSTPSGTSGGIVTFMDGSTLIGTAAVDSTTEQAVGFTSSLGVGTHTITALYGGGTGFLASTSSAISETVNPAGADTTTTLAASANPATQGNTLSLTATVTSATGTPSGTVTFDDGSVLIGTATIDPTTHQAVAFTSSLLVGTHEITASYNGVSGFAPSASSVLSEVINPVGTLTTTTLASSSLGVVTGQTITLTASVTSGGGAPAGDVNFLDGTTLLTTLSIDPTTQEAIYTVPMLSAGVNNLTAVYVGGGGFATSTSAIVHENVNPDATATTLVASANNFNAGTSVTLTATVVPDAPGGGVAAGTVTFENGSTVVGTASVNPTTQQAVLTTTSLTPGADSVTAVYAATPAVSGGVTAYSASTSPAVNETVIGIATTTTVSVGTASVTMGATEALTATVTGVSGATPTGTITFASGATTIGTATLNSSGIATYDEYNLFTGTYPVTATYSGDNLHTTSASTNTASFAVTTPTYTSVSLNGSTYQTVTANTGTGASTVDGQFVAVDYTGYTDGTLFQTSVGSTPLPLGVGEGGTIAAFNAGVVGMKLGETRVLVIPPALGYGSSPPADTGITATSTLTFIVRLVALNVPRLTVSYVPSGTNPTPVQLTLNQTPSTTIGTDFGSETVGTSGTVSSFTLGDADSEENITSTTTPIIQITGADPSDFVITQPTSLLPTTDSNGNTTGGTFTIAFLPTATGTRTATIQISTSDPSVPTYTFTVTGIGT